MVATARASYGGDLSFTICMKPMSTPAPDPVFRQVAAHDLAVHSDAPDAQMADWLAFQVSAEPANLLGHVRRIAYERRYGDAASTAAAMTDLLIVLGPRGRTLKQRMLALCKRAMPGALAAITQPLADTGRLGGQVRLLHRLSAPSGGRRQ